MLSLCGARAQYISEVLEYTPAPGQFINSAPWGVPQSALSLVGGVNGSLSLGAFGGTVVFRFEEAVENHPDNPFGVDFTIFGNPMHDWSEPGVVSVMEDVNGNGLADDQWYELAGSDYYFSTTRRNFRLSYINPGTTIAEDVPWQDEEENTGFILANSAHTQPYYPLTDSFSVIPSDTLTLTGTLLEGAVDVDHPPLLVSKKRAFGYADNQLRGTSPYTIPDNPYTTEVENSGGDAFDISWAVDEMGEYVELNQIHFIRVQAGILHQGGYLGEVSTEICGAVDVAPDRGISGITSLLVIKDLPAETDLATPLRMEGFLFHGGRLEKEAVFHWSCKEDWAHVDEDGMLIKQDTGMLSISATVSGEPELQAAVSTTIIENQLTTGYSEGVFTHIGLYPNPAGEEFRIRGVQEAVVTIFDVSGRMISQISDYREGMVISVGRLGDGLYLVKVGSEGEDEWLRLVKQ